MLTALEPSPTILHAMRSYFWFYGTSGTPGAGAC